MPEIQATLELAKERTTKIIAVCDIPCFVGTDMIDYPERKQGEEFEVPIPIGKLLLARGLAYKKTADKDPREEGVKPENIPFTPAWHNKRNNPDLADKFIQEVKADLAQTPKEVITPSETKQTRPKKGSKKEESLEITIKLKGDRLKFLKKMCKEKDISPERFLGDCVEGEIIYEEEEEEKRKKEKAEKKNKGGKK